MSEQPSAPPREASAGFVQRVLIVVGIAAVAAALASSVIFAVNVFLLLFAGALFACFLHGLSRLIAGHTRVPYWGALAIVCLALVGVATGVGVFVAPQISQQMDVLADELSSAAREAYARIEEAHLLRRVPDSMREPATWLPSDFSAMGTLGGVFSTVVGALTGVVVILFMGLYVAVDPGLYRRGVVALFPVHRRGRMREVLRTLRETMWWWMLGRLASMAIIGVLTTLGLWLLNIPVPVALGLLAALLTFIPNVGPLLALIPPTLLAMRAGPMWAVGVVAFYLGVQAVESYVITPLIQKRAISIPPVLTLASQLLLAYFTGILGLAVATPLAAAGMVLVRELYVRDALESPPQPIAHPG